MVLHATNLLFITLHNAYLIKAQNHTNVTTLKQGRVDSEKPISVINFADTNVMSTIHLNINDMPVFIIIIIDVIEVSHRILFTVTSNVYV